MRKEKKTEHWSRYVAEIPDGFPQDSASAWPPLADWPTTKAVRRVLKKTKGAPDRRLDVLSGLRQFAASDAQSLWSFAGVWLAVLIATLSMPIPAPGVYVVGALLLGVGLWVLSFIADRSMAIHERTVRARIWLAALEDEIVKEGS